MKDVSITPDVQAQRDVDLLRGLAAIQFAYGGLSVAQQLLDLACLIKADDPASLVLAARISARLGDLPKACQLMANAVSWSDQISQGDLAFFRALQEQLDRQSDADTSTPSAILGKSDQTSEKS